MIAIFSWFKEFSSTEDSHLKEEEEVNSFCSKYDKRQVKSETNERLEMNLNFWREVKKGRRLQFHTISFHFISSQREQQQQQH